MSNETVLTFYESSPFYPLVIGYMAQLVGFAILSKHGVGGVEELEGVLASILARENVSETTQAEVRRAQRTLSDLSGSLALLTTLPTNRVVFIPANDLARDFADNMKHLSGHLVPIASSVLIAAYEVGKEGKWADQGPLWEFLRHCRNAMAHGGRFDFRKGEPKRPAAWHYHTITAALQGTPLMRPTSADVGLLYPGDPIQLLFDIEEATPAMRGTGASTPAS